MKLVGIIGLGNMGSALAANLVGAGNEVLAFDLAGASRMPAGATFVDSVEKLAEQVDVIVLSLPDGNASQRVAASLAATPEMRTQQVVDTSTIGPGAAQAVASLLVDRGVGYVDAPVSGGVRAARARTLMVMFAGSDVDCDAVAPVLDGLSDRRRRVGDRPGMAQALKLANNFLSATSLAATSEAIAFLMATGLDMAVALEVINLSSGQSNATSDKFTNQVLPATYAAGFGNTLMSKDVRLYAASVDDLGSPVVLSAHTNRIWDEFATAEPDADFTRIYPFIAGPRAVSEPGRAES